MNPWLVLNIKKTDDKELVKKAYMQMLKKHNPEEDQEGFQKIRAAYEMALAEIDGKDEESSVPPPIAEFIKKMRTLYDDFQKRIVAENWENLLKDDVCLRLELENELIYNILEFLMAHNYLPASVWKLIGGKFDIELQEASLKKEFHPVFIDFVIGNIREEKGFSYDAFDVTENKDFDRAIYLRNEISIRIDGKELDGIDELFEELDALEIYHPDFILEKARYMALTEKPADALKIADELFSKHKKHYEDSTYAAYVKGAILMEFDDEEHLNQAEEVYRELLEKHPEYYYAQINMLETLIKLDKLEKALEFAKEEVMARSPSSPFVLYQIFRINDLLLIKNEEKYEQDPSSSELITDLADCYCSANRTEDAYDLLMKHSEINTAEYFGVLAFCCEKKGDYEKAIEYSERSNELEPKYGNYLTIIKALAALKQPEKAMETADYALSQDLPVKGYQILNKAFIFMTKAEIYKELKQYNDAMTAINSAIELHGQMAQLYATKAELCLSMGDFAEAIEQAEIAAALFPLYESPYETMAQVFYITGNFDQVDEIIERAEQFNIKGHGLKFFKACSLHQENEHGEAIKMMKELLTEDDLGKWEEKTYLALHDVYADNGESEKAYGCLTEGLEKLPDNENLLEELGYYYGDKEDKRAADVWERLIKLNPNNETAFNQLAMHLQDAGRPEEAIKLLDKKISDSPKTINLRIRRGLIFHAMKRQDDALADLFYALENGKQQRLWWSVSAIHYEIATIYHRDLNDAPNALKYFELSLKTYDEQRDDNIMLINYFMGHTYAYHFKDDSKAIEYYNEALTADETDHATYYERGVAYQREGKINLAEKDFIKVLELCGRDKITYHGDYTYVAEAYIALGERRKAHAAMTKAAKLVKKDGTDGGDCYCVYRGWALYYLSQGDKKKATQNIDKALSMLNSVYNNYLKLEISAM